MKKKAKKAKNAKNAEELLLMPHPAWPYKGGTSVKAPMPDASVLRVDYLKKGELLFVTTSYTKNGKFYRPKQMRQMFALNLS